MGRQRYSSTLFWVLNSNIFQPLWAFCFPLVKPFASVKKKLKWRGCYLAQSINSAVSSPVPVCPPEGAVEGLEWSAHPAPACVNVAESRSGTEGKAVTAPRNL